jgi:hypothetical protein
MWGLVLSAITIGVSMIVGTKEEGNNTTTGSNNTSINIRNYPIFRDLLHGDNQLFLSGAGKYGVFIFYFLLLQLKFFVNLNYCSNKFFMESHVFAFLLYFLNQPK